jgi:hypothetical protein
MRNSGLGSVHQHWPFARQMGGCHFPGNQPDVDFQTQLITTTNPHRLRSRCYSSCQLVLAEFTGRIGAENFAQSLLSLPTVARACPSSQTGICYG